MSERGLNWTDDLAVAEYVAKLEGRIAELEAEVERLKSYNDLQASSVAPSLRLAFNNGKREGLELAAEMARREAGKWDLPQPTLGSSVLRSTLLDVALALEAKAKEAAREDSEDD